MGLASLRSRARCEGPEARRGPKPRSVYTKVAFPPPSVSASTAGSPGPPKVADCKTSSGGLVTAEGGDARVGCLLLGVCLSVDVERHLVVGQEDGTTPAPADSAGRRKQLGEFL